MAKGKEYHGLNEKELEKLFKILEKKKPIGAIKQYIDALKELYKNIGLNSGKKKNTYYPALGVAVSLLEISLVRLYYFIKRKNGMSVEEAIKVRGDRIYKTHEDIQNVEWEKAFNTKIDSWDNFLENAKVKELYNEQRGGERALKRFRNAVVHGKIAGLQEEDSKMDKTNILLCIDCAMLIIVGIISYFRKLTGKYLLDNMLSLGLPKSGKKGKRREVEGLSDEEKKKTISNEKKKEIEGKIATAKRKLLWPSKPLI